MTKCIDESIGSLLLAYEMGALSEDDEKRVEIHLMSCQHCLDDVTAFRRYADVLNDSEKIKRAMARYAPTAQSVTPGRTLLQYLWPEAPLFFKPAVAMLLVLLLIIPAYLGWRSFTDGGSDIRPVQTIRLVPTRSAEPCAFSIESGLDGAISFAVPDYPHGKLYDVAVVDDQGKVVVRLSSVASIDERGMGQIIVPHRLMKPGTYSLIVTNAGSGAAASEYRYTFVIKP